MSNMTIIWKLHKELRIPVGVLLGEGGKLTSFTSLPGS